MGNIAVMRTLALVVRGIKVHYEIKWTRAACRLVSRGPPYTRRSVFTKSSGCWTKLAPNTVHLTILIRLAKSIRRVR